MLKSDIPLAPKVGLCDGVLPWPYDELWYFEECWDEGIRMESRLRTVSASRKRKNQAPCVFGGWHDQGIRRVIPHDRGQLYAEVPCWWGRGVERSRMGGVQTPLVFTKDSNVAIKPSSSAGKVSLKDVLFQVAATDHTVITTMEFILAAHDATNNILTANEVCPGCGVLLSIPRNVANNIEDFGVYNIVRASSVVAARALRAFRDA